jgi:hypothetical protein
MLLRQKNQHTQTDNFLELYNLMKNRFTLYKTILALSIAKYQFTIMHVCYLKRKTDLNVLTIIIMKNILNLVTYKYTKLNQFFYYCSSYNFI